MPEQALSGLEALILPIAQADRVPRAWRSKTILELPQIIAVQVTEGIPLKRCDGEVVWRSDQTVRLSGGAAQITIPNGKVTDIKKMRLFFENEENYYLYRFVHPLYRRD